MVNNISFSPSFCKQLKAKATIQCCNEPEKCFIYELSTEKDSDYFEKLGEKDWDSSVFIDVFDMRIKDKNNNEHIHVLESAKKELLGIVQVNDDLECGENQFVEYLATKPIYSSKNDYRDRKYIGQTLMAFLAKNFDNNYTQCITIKNPLASAVDFYIDKCNFSPVDDDSLILFLPKKDFNKLIQRNEESTQGGLELFC